MAFFASLLAYLVSVGGIVLVFAMSYAVLVAPPPDQTPSMTRPNAAIVQQQTAPQPDAAVKATHVVRSREGRHVAQDEVAMQRKSHASATRRALAANEASRERHTTSPGNNAYAGLWAFQQPPNRAAWGLGYAEEQANGYDRNW